MAIKELMIYIHNVDDILDDRVHMDYKGACALAQDWARVAKIMEEGGEAIQELISWTGQNPRKGPPDPAARTRLLKELADTALTALYAMQHFQKNVAEVFIILEATAQSHYERLSQ